LSVEQLKQAWAGHVKEDSSPVIMLVSALIPEFSILAGAVPVADLSQVNRLADKIATSFGIVDTSTSYAS